MVAWPQVRCCDPRESVRLVVHPRWPLEAEERGHTTVTQEYIQMSAPSLRPPWLASQVRCCDPRESVRLVANPRWPLEAEERGES